MTRIPSIVRGGEHSNEVGGRNTLEFDLNLFTHIKIRNNLLNSLLRDLLTTGMLFDNLIGIRIALSAKDRLDGFGHHNPMVLEIFLQLSLVQVDLVQSIVQIGKCQDRVANGHTNIPENSGIYMLIMSIITILLS